MCRNLILLLTLLVALFTSVEVSAAKPDPQTLIRRGVDLFDYGRWSDARHEFMRAHNALTLADRRESQQVDYYLAACAVELGDPDAGDALKSFSMRWPASVYGNDVRFSLASYYCARGDMQTAAREFALVDYKSLSPRRREQYNIRMGYVAFSNKRYDEAYDYFGRIASRSEYVDHALYYRSYIDYTRGRYPQAKDGFLRLASSGSYARLVPYYLLQLEFMAANYNYVVEYGDALAVKAVPQHRMEIYRVLAESWYHLGDYGKALEYLGAFLRDGGNTGRNEAYLMGYSLYRTARYAEAEEYLRRACGADDALTQNASYHLADCYVRRGAKREAMQSFSLAANGHYNSAVAEDALFNYGKLQYELGGGIFNEAINVLMRYLESYPTSPRTPQAMELLVAAYYNSHNYDAAYTAIKSFLDPHGDLRAALQKIAYFRALEAFANGDIAAAKLLLTESASIGVSPKYNALALFWQGEVAYAEGDFTMAMARYDAYMKRAPQDAQEYALACYNIGYCRFSQGRMVEARDAFAKFLNLNNAPTAYRADAWNRLGDAQLAGRAFDAAVASYDKAAAMGGILRDYALYQRAMALGLQHKTAAKIDLLKQIVASGEGDYADDAAYELGRTHIAQEQYADGVRVLERFVEQYPSSLLRGQALSDLGLACLNLGDKERSLKYYDMVVVASPRSAEAKGAMEGIRDIYVSQGDVDAYFDYARKVGVESDVTVVARDSLTFTAAQQLYIVGNHTQAAKALRGYVDRYPKGYYLTDALYYLGDSYLHLNRRSEAIETLILLSSQGMNNYTITVLDRLAEMTYADKRYIEAATAFRRLYDVVSKNEERHKAMTGYVRATLAQSDISKVEPMAMDVAAQANAGVVAMRESQFALAEQKRMNGNSKGALPIYRKLAVEVKTPEGAAAAYYVLKDTFDTGDMAKAEKALFDFTDKNTPQAYWLAKAYIMLGDIYAVRCDAFQARATYQSVADGYTPSDDGIVDEAKARIEKLKN